MADSLLSAFTGIFSAVPPAAWIVTTFAGIGLGALSARLAYTTPSKRGMPCVVTLSSAVPPQACTR